MIALLTLPQFINATTLSPLNHIHYTLAAYFLLSPRVIYMSNKPAYHTADEVSEQVVLILDSEYAAKDEKMLQSTLE